MAESFTGVILPRFWEELRHLPLQVRALAAYLVTNEHMDGVAGLARLSMVTIADDLAVTLEELAELWRELEKGAPGFVQVDAQRRLVRVPKAPRAGHRPNHKVLRAWWRHWQLLPDCELRTAHVLSLAACLSDSVAPEVAKAWDDTFGTVAPTVALTVREPLANGRAENSHSAKSKGSTVREPLANRSGTVGQRSVVSDQWSVISGEERTTEGDLQSARGETELEDIPPTPEELANLGRRLARFTGSPFAGEPT